MKKSSLTKRQDIINGFSASFTEELLDKLKKIRNECLRKEVNTGINQDIAKTVLSYLLEQMRLKNQFPDPNSDWTLPDVNRLIDTTEEFLFIFRCRLKLL